MSYLLSQALRGSNHEYSFGPGEGSSTNGAKDVLGPRVFLVGDVEPTASSRKVSEAQDNGEIKTQDKDGADVQENASGSQTTSVYPNTLTRNFQDTSAAPESSKDSTPSKEVVPAESLEPMKEAEARLYRETRERARCLLLEKLQHSIRTRTMGSHRVNIDIVNSGTAKATPEPHANLKFNKMNPKATEFQPSPNISIDCMDQMLKPVHRELFASQWVIDMHIELVIDSLEKFSKQQWAENADTENDVAERLKATVNVTTPGSH